MSEEEKQPLPETQPEAEPITYASPLKRVWAWVGVVYMILIVFLMTYMFAYGSYLHSIGPLMLIPALGGIGASSVCVWRQSGKRDLPHGIFLALILLACAALIVLNLVNGIPALLSNFGG